MIKSSSAYALVLNGVCIAKGSAAAMRAMKKKSRSAVIWLSNAAVVGDKLPSADHIALVASLDAAEAAYRSAA
jgi:hypothetical protein